MTLEPAPKPVPRRRFRGLSDLVDALTELIDRPAWRAAKISELRGDRPLPLVCLIGESAPEVLDGLAKGMAGRTRKPPFARVPLDAPKRQQDSDTPPSVLPLLEVLRQALRLPVYGSAGRPRFRHYQLVDWLTRRRLDGEPDSKDDTGPTLRAIRTWYTRGMPVAINAEAGPDLSLY